MEFITLAGLSEDQYVDLDHIMANEGKIATRIKDVYAFLPNVLKRRGHNVLQKQHQARVVLSFLRACARRELAFIQCLKRGVRVGTKTKTISRYRLVVVPKCDELKSLRTLCGEQN